MVNGKEVSVMVSASKPGRMELSTWESGEKIVLMEKASLSTLMETFTMVTGLTTKRMAQGFTSM